MEIFSKKVQCMLFARFICQKIVSCTLKAPVATKETK